MSFSFEFDLSTGGENDQETGEANLPSSHHKATDKDGLSLSVNDKSCTATRNHLLPFHWVANLSQLLEDRQEDRIVYDEVSIDSDDKKCDNSTAKPKNLTSTLLRVDLTRSSFRKAASSSSSSSSSLEAQGQLRNTTNDLIPGVYEGGLKVWESAIDLVQYLHLHDNQPHDTAAALPPWSFLTMTPQRRLRFLEIGCGHGLPLCYILRQALKRNALSQIELIAADYNDYVLRDAFVSNILLNVVADYDVMNHEAMPNRLAQCIKMGAGDWYGLLSEENEQNTTNEPSSSSSLLHQMDWIAATETLYSVQAAQETAILVSRLLRPETGQAWVASKRYYFGVGGGTDAFRQAANALGPIRCSKDGIVNRRLDIETVCVYDNGKSNIRELLCVRLVKA